METLNIFCTHSILPRKNQAWRLLLAPSEVYRPKDSISRSRAEKNLTARILEKTSAKRPLILESCSASKRSYFIFFRIKKEIPRIFKATKPKKIRLIVLDSLIRTTKEPTRIIKKLRKL